VSRRPLVPVLGLAIGDYALWNWSLNGNHDVLALISGLTLPPLAVACVWLLALSVAELIAANLRRPSLRSLRSRRERGARTGRRGGRSQPAAPGVSAVEDSHAATAQARADARKLAA
jgi:hypothetical protein